MFNMTAQKKKINLDAKNWSFANYKVSGCQVLVLGWRLFIARKCGENFWLERKVGKLMGITVIKIFLAKFSIRKSINFNFLAQRKSAQNSAKSGTWALSDRTG